jgi:hypothetical protein
MGYLVNASCPVDFATGITISAWLRVPPAGDFDSHIFFEFGNNGVHGYPSSVSYNGGAIQCVFAGRSFAHPLIDYFIHETPAINSYNPYTSIEDAVDGLTHGGPPMVGNGFSTSLGFLVRSWNQTTDASALATANSNLATKQAMTPSAGYVLETRPSTLYDAVLPGAGNWHTPFYFIGTDGLAFPASSWHHVLIAVDCSGGIVDKAEVLAGPHAAPTLSNSLTHDSPFNIIIDGVDQLGQPTQIGSVFTSYTPNSVFDANLNSSGSGIVASGYPLYVPCNPSPTSILGINGTGALEGALLKEYGDFQVWNKYIDPTISANYAKFVTISGGVGRPASYTAASNAFGAPDILFHGKSSDLSFYNNRGTAGTFTKSGTVSDYTPTPSYG